jgi:hypothetical protein
VDVDVEVDVDVDVDVDVVERGARRRPSAHNPTSGPLQNSGSPKLVTSSPSARRTET